MVSRRETKQDVLDDIAVLVRRPLRFTSRGSTETKDALLDVVNALGLGVDPRSSKPKIARAIAEAAGLRWTSACDSTQSRSGGGSTVTLEGLRTVRRAVSRLVR